MCIHKNHMNTQSHRNLCYYVKFGRIQLLGVWYYELNCTIRKKPIVTQFCNHIVTQMISISPPLNYPVSVHTFIHVTLGSTKKTKSLNSPMGIKYDMMHSLGIPNLFLFFLCDASRWFLIRVGQKTPFPIKNFVGAFFWLYMV